MLVPMPTYCVAHKVRTVADLHEPQTAAGFLLAPFAPDVDASADAREVSEELEAPERQQPHGGRGELQHRCRRRMGVRRRPVLPRGDDRARLPIRDQLCHLFNDALTVARFATHTRELVGYLTERQQISTGHSLQRSGDLL